MGFQSQDVEHQARTGVAAEAPTPAAEGEAQQLGQKEKTTNPDQPRHGGPGAVQHEPTTPDAAKVR